MSLFLDSGANRLQRGVGRHPAFESPISSYTAFAGVYGPFHSALKGRVGPTSLPLASTAISV